ncbi:MAG TPA: Uma2 family endonuclease [Labilithrix sp.]|nr:Uma2 family endonuclease [Labilithrix sp.]
MGSQRFPGYGPPAVDDRIVAPESRAEILEGRLIFAPPALEKDAVPHADLAYVLRAHVKDGFNVAVDMLTRTSEKSDFAPDVSVYEAARDPETGGRRLEELAFEIVNEQAIAEQTTKARELTRRGVRRVFCLVVKQEKIIEWSRATDGWAATPLDVIDDACLARPLPTDAVLKATRADDAVLQALRAKGHPQFDAVREEGREEGREAALRIGVLDLCESYEIALDEGRRARIADMRERELDTLRLTLKKYRRWPDV